MSQIDPFSSAPPPSGNRVPPLLALLRAETRAAHDRIESLPELCCLLSPTLTVGPYVQALRGLHTFHACMWATLPPLLSGLFAGCDAETEAVQPTESALRALADDLAWFGARPARRMGAVAAVSDAASALGALYVVEGSALGARVIGRSVAESLGVAPGGGGSFFCGATADAARHRWQSFSSALARAENELGPDAGARVVAGALAVFAKLERAFGHSTVSTHAASLSPTAHLSPAPVPAARILN